MTVPDLVFDLSGFQVLDSLALQAQESWNYGNANNWFFSFRASLFPMYNRLRFAAQHYHDLHNWNAHPLGSDYDYHVPIIFFCFDSAIECFVFGLNVVGFTIDAPAFIDTQSAPALRAVSPRNILDDPMTLPKGARKPPAGWARYFPTLQSYWRNEKTLIQQIMDQHDVSKHRQMIAPGASVLPDREAPKGYREFMGIPPGAPFPFKLNPAIEVYLYPDPKAPITQQLPSGHMKLEDIAPKFVAFINRTGELAFEDAKKALKLNPPPAKQ